MAELLCLNVVIIAFRYLSENHVLNQKVSLIIVKNENCTAVVSRKCFCEGNGLSARGNQSFSHLSTTCSDVFKLFLQLCCKNETNCSIIISAGNSSSRYYESLFE